MAAKLLKVLQSFLKSTASASALFAAVLGIGALPQAHAQNQPPVTVSATAAGQFVGQSFTLSGRATDANGNLAYMNFYVYGPGIPPWQYVGTAALSGADATASFNYTPNTAGTYYVHIRAWDTNGAVDSNGTVVHAFNVVSNTAPTTVSVSTTLGYVGQPVTFTGRATDPDGNLAQMNFYVYGPGIPPWQYLGTAALSGADATASFNYTPSTAGTYYVHIRAFDSMGAVDSNGTIVTQFSVVDPPPTAVSLTATGQFVGQAIAFSGRAKDTGANLASMHFWVMGPNLPPWHHIGSVNITGADATASLSYTFDAPGEHRVHIRAYDATGKVDSTDLVTVFTVKAPSKILVDVNQLNVCEAQYASTFAADGVWALPYNSPDITESLWTSTFLALNGSSFIISEDDVTVEPATNRFRSVDRVSAMMGRMVDGAVFYDEQTPGFDFGAMPTLSYGKINEIAAHVVPGYGPIGARVIVLTRMYAQGNPARAWVDAALSNPNVAGLVFESQPITSNWDDTLDVAGGLRACLNANKKCFMLLPPPPASSGYDYLARFQDTMKYFEQKQLLRTPNLHFVPAIYLRLPGHPGDTNVGFVPNVCGSYSRTVSEVVSWLRSYLNGTAQ